MEVPKVSKAIVLLSGGLDSVTALHWAHARGWDCIALNLWYGQRHACEAECAEYTANLLEVPYYTKSMTVFDDSPLTQHALGLPDREISDMSQGRAPTYVSFRNTIMLATAASLAGILGAHAIVGGWNVLDYSGYPDCRPEYLRAMTDALRLGGYIPDLSIYAPLIAYDKQGIINLGLSLGVDYAHTWSCYAGGLAPCGVCDSCKLRAKGFAACGMEDPALLTQKGKS